MYESLYETIDIIKLTKMQSTDLFGLKYQLEKHLAAVNSVIESCYIKQSNYSNVPLSSSISTPMTSNEVVKHVKVKVKPKVPNKKAASGKKRGRPSKAEVVQEPEAVVMDVEVK